MSDVDRCTHSLIDAATGDAYDCTLPAAHKGRHAFDPYPAGRDALKEALSASEERARGLERERDELAGANLLNRNAVRLQKERAEKAEAESARLTADLERVRGALGVILSAVRQDEKHQYHDARAWLDERGIYNGDLDGAFEEGCPVLEAVARAALSALSTKEPSEDRKAAIRWLCAGSPPDVEERIRARIALPGTEAASTGTGEGTLAHDWDPEVKGTNLRCRRCGLDLAQLAAKTMPTQCDGPAPAPEPGRAEGRCEYRIGNWRCTRPPHEGDDSHSIKPAPAAGDAPPNGRNERAGCGHVTWVPEGAPTPLRCNGASCSGALPEGA